MTLLWAAKWGVDKKNSHFARKEERYARGNAPWTVARRALAGAKIENVVENRLDLQAKKGRRCALIKKRCTRRTAAAGQDSSEGAA